jgi:hypothetical protein
VTVNPAALILLVVGVVAVIVGVKGTQRQTGALLGFGTPSAGTAAATSPSSGPHATLAAAHLNPATHHTGSGA